MRRRLLLLGALLGLAVPATASEGAPLAPIPPDAWTREAAAHLLRRAGFGGPAEEVDRLHALGLDGAVRRLVHYEEIPWRDAPRLEIEVRGQPLRGDLEGKSEAERRELRRDYRRQDQRQAARLKEWWLRRMVSTPRPLEERITLFWHGHFPSAHRTVRDSYKLYVQNTTFRGLATDRFDRLLHEVARDPAMLRYLDGDRNRKDRPNENFAREVMELFTVGEGRYGERDVKEAARAFTGWTVVGGRFRMNPAQHDPHAKTILGRTGPFDGNDVLEILLERPETARRLAERLFVAFVHDHPSDVVLDELAAQLREEGYALKPVLTRLFRSQVFYGPEARASGIKSPVDLLVGLLRTLEIPPPPGTLLAPAIARLGQDLLDPPDVKGWDGGRAWISTSRLLDRYNLAVALVGTARDRETLGTVPSRVRRPGPGAPAASSASRGRRPQRAARTRPLYDAVADLERRQLTEAAEIVAHYERTLLAQPLSPSARAALESYLVPSPRESAGPIERERVHGLLRLLVSTPEFQVR